MIHPKPAGYHIDPADQKIRIYNTVIQLHHCIHDLFRGGCLVFQIDRSVCVFWHPSSIAVNGHFPVIRISPFWIRQVINI